ncbi:putative serine/threonine protein kinase [Blattamonas nauphoetae]|uniref:Serine/threonine protein kinase n=1 Tax=Blattamonas nauphoetae TaxID=2049346 RepID=A0ABQ9WNJ8_9EUKA|nr:putative serine/threonine protein kinase [Blattamonas nauphoetae]
MTSLGKEYPIDEKDYKILCHIGKGSSALVYKALCKPLDEEVAIKIVDLERVKGNLDTILKEVKILMLSHHPNVAHVHISFIHNSSLWVVQPLFEGSCHDMMKSVFHTGFDEASIATILHGTLNALNYIHNEGHIHRDVKAANLLLDKSGNVYLGDFGVSGCLIENGMRRESRNTFVGTPCWMSPEVVDQSIGYDYKADIWSLGITAIELANGSAPYATYPPVKVLMMILHNEPPKPEDPKDRAPLSQHFRDFVSQCLRREQTKRPSAAELLNHPFIRGKAKDASYLQQTILRRMPPLEVRARKEKEAIDQMMKSELPQTIPKVTAVSAMTGSVLDQYVKGGELYRARSIANSRNGEWDFSEEEVVKYLYPIPSPVPPQQQSPASLASPTPVRPSQNFGVSFDHPSHSESPQPNHPKQEVLQKVSPITRTTSFQKVGRFQVHAMDSPCRAQQDIPSQSNTPFTQRSHPNHAKKENDDETPKHPATKQERHEHDDLAITLTAMIRGLLTQEREKDREERRKEEERRRMQQTVSGSPLFHMSELETAFLNCSDDVVVLWRENRRLRKRLKKYEPSDSADGASSDDDFALKSYEWTVKPEKERLRRRREKRSEHLDSSGLELSDLSVKDKTKKHPG